MGWTNDQTESLTLPPGAGPGSDRVVIGPDIPADLQTAYGHIGDSVTDAIIFYEGGTPADARYNFIAQFSQGGIALGAMVNGEVAEQIFSIANQLSATDIDYDPGINTTPFLVTEPWHDFPAANGWTLDASNPLRYRRVPSPSQCVQVCGVIKAPSPFNGSMGTMPNTPLDYTSFGQAPVWAWTGGTASLVRFDSTGAVSAFGDTTPGAFWWISGIYPVVR